MIFVGEVGLGFMYITLFSLWDSMLSEGGWFVRSFWWCVVCCVSCSCLCWSLGGGTCWVLGSDSSVFSVGGVGVGFARVTRVRCGGPPLLRRL